ncbi:uncharacterized protein MYCFIDRAFT_212266 [Pseudocercospora fijiensis CIRAD86]|uniref:C2H2-type domain-containing protein n=1 Tax=Pseudocercospora fijiensis (strain CIRAD86) TaxID=383855 RepID=M3AQ99_PSEFD|nr:uncharacterized protein MYCFIDRAFT_212266 [Pseudocercospora fijiensis CIRAD86]EME79617.1 hypothetical protein MYCFIDRAFT_212266 [Pseudocercospora fijiensis CIRAD86]
MHWRTALGQLQRAIQVSEMTLDYLGSNSSVDVEPDVALLELIQKAESISTPTSPIEPLMAREEEYPCTECGEERTRRGSIVADPTQANAGRSRYACTNQKCRRGRNTRHEYVWHIWEVHGESPVCDCGLLSRQGMFLSRSGTGRTGYGFWECAYGTCKYFSTDRKGRSVINGEVKKANVEQFIPWSASVTNVT